MILRKCNNLCVEMLFSSETKLQIEENPPYIPENKMLELNVTSNIYRGGDLTAAHFSSPQLAVLNLNDCKRITLAETDLKKLANLVFICLRNTGTTPNDDSSHIVWQYCVFLSFQLSYDLTHCTFRRLIFVLILF